ncbi:porin [Rhodopseudomonas pseudopalustris]|uniref:Porin n=1 Tax=Rhodopseudomonas pseudopalustris TaxID=1513892 RepID=A0A1H8VYB4_9BRAD|nr:porin [Rhodopseudomonas pseudopalustris]SEP20442.1 Porin subfamily protein [Rhodopseudomonas pseudopalustris]
MNMVKSLFLGSAAALVAMSGAQAADLPLKAKAVEYVKVCSIYGAGFYYIPGTDTCIKLGGYLRADVTMFGAGAYNAPAWNGAAGAKSRLANNTIFRSRQDINIDTRTATEYGVVRTYFDATFSWTSGDAIAGGTLGVYYAFIQFAGFTFGKAVSQFDTPWTGYPGNNTSFLIGGYDNVTGINQVAYTAQFGNGVSAAISLEDQSSYLQSALYNTSNLTDAGFATGVYGTNSYAGTQIPDIVGQLRVDQAWGLFQLSAAAHQVRASYYNTALETSGHPSDTWGYAVQGALSLKNLPTGPGDSFNITATYSDGATRYVLGGVTGNSFAIYGNSGGAYQSLALAGSADGVFAGTNNINGSGITKTTAWGVRGAFNHNWNPFWSTSLFGSYTALDYKGTATAQICATAVGFTCNPDFRIAQIGTVTRWTPVKNLTFSGEVMYTYLDQSHAGNISLPAVTAVAKPAAVYELKDQGVWSGSLRVQRTF